MSFQWSLQRGLDSIFFNPFCYVLICIDKIPLEPTSPNWTVPGLSAFFHVTDTPILLSIFVTLHWSATHCSSMPLPFLYWEPRTAPLTPRVSYQRWVEMRDHLSTYWQGSCSKAPRLLELRWLSALIAERVQCWLMYSLVPTRISRDFSVKQFSSWLELASAGFWGCSSPGAVVSISLCSIWWGFSAHVSSLLRYVWVAAWPLGISVPSPSLASFKKSMRIFLVPLYRLLMNKFINIVPTIEITALIFGFQLKSVPLFPNVCQVKRFLFNFLPGHFRTVRTTCFLLLLPFFQLYYKLVKYQN